MKKLIFFALLIFSVNAIGQNKAIITRDNLNRHIVKKDSTITYDEFFTDSTASDILRRYEYKGSGKVFWFNGVKIVLKKYAFFFTRKPQFR